MAKKLFAILSIVVLIFAFSACAAEAQSYQGDQNEIVMTIDSKEVSLFGQKTQNDVAPIISNGRTMLPARLVAESLGAKVSWDEAQRKVTVVRNDITIKMYVDSDIVYINGKKHKLDSAVFIKDSRTYTPVRFIAELLDAKVSWLGETRQVVINKEPLVTDAVNYTKKIIDYYGWNQDYGNHTINIPKINIDTPAAAAFNQKIFEEYEEELTELKNNKEEHRIYEINYQYAVNNGVVAILVSNPNMGQGSGYGEKYDGYYYDTSADKELSFAEYLSMLNVDFKKLTNETNAIYEATADQYDDHDLAASFSSKNRVENALLSPGKVIVSHYSNHGVAVGDRLLELDCSLFDLSNKMQEELELYVLAEEKLTEYYNANLQSFGYDFIKPDNIFLADLDSDKIPELCVNYGNGGYHSWIEIYKYTNGEVYISEANIASGYGTGILSGFELVLLDSGDILIYETLSSTWLRDSSYNNHSFYEYYWKESGVIFNYKLTVSSEGNEYKYSENGAEDVTITASERNEWLKYANKRYNDLYKDKSIDIANCGFNEIWELQKSR